MTDIISEMTPDINVEDEIKKSEEDFGSTIDEQEITNEEDENEAVDDDEKEEEEEEEVNDDVTEEEVKAELNEDEKEGVHEDNIQIIPESSNISLNENPPTSTAEVCFQKSFPTLETRAKLNKIKSLLSSFGEDEEKVTLFLNRMREIKKATNIVEKRKQIICSSMNEETKWRFSIISSPSEDIDPPTSSEDQVSILNFYKKQILNTMKKNRNLAESLKSTVDRYGAFMKANANLSPSKWSGKTGLIKLSSSVLPNVCPDVYDLRELNRLLTKVETDNYKRISRFDTLLDSIKLIESRIQNTRKRNDDEAKTAIFNTKLGHMRAAERNEVAREWKNKTDVLSRKLSSVHQSFIDVNAPETPLVVATNNAIKYFDRNSVDLPLLRSQRDPSLKPDPDKYSKTKLKKLSDSQKHDIKTGALIVKASPASTICSLRRNIFNYVQDNSDLLNQLKHIQNQGRLYQVKYRSLKVDVENNYRRRDNAIRAEVAAASHDNNTHNIDVSISEESELLSSISKCVNSQEFFALFEKSESDRLLCESIEDVSTINEFDKQFVHFAYEKGMEAVSLLDTKDSEIDSAISVASLEFGSLYLNTQHMYSLIKGLQELNRIYSLDTAIQFLQETSCNLLNCDRCTFWVISDDTYAWTRTALSASADVKSSSMDTIRIPLDRGFVGSCFQQQKIITVADAYMDNRFNRSVDLATNYRTRSVLCVPILRDGKVCAIFQAINKLSTTTSTFEKPDIYTLYVLGYTMLDIVYHCEEYERLEQESSSGESIINMTVEIFTNVSNRLELLLFIREKFEQLFSAAASAVFLCYKDYVKRLDINRDGSAISEVNTNSRFGFVGHVMSSKEPLKICRPAWSKLFDETIDIYHTPTSTSATVGTSSSNVGIGGGFSTISADEETLVPWLFCWPLIHGDSVCAILQWIVYDKKRFDDSTPPIDENLINSVLQMIQYFIDRWWPCSDRLKQSQPLYLLFKPKGNSLGVTQQDAKMKAAFLIQRAFRKFLELRKSVRESGNDELPSTD